MAADYLVSSLQPLSFGAPAPCGMEAFLSECRAQLSAAEAEGIAAAVEGRPSEWGPAREWADLDAQIRNAVAQARAKAKGLDPSAWLRPAEGRSLHWAGRVAAAFREGGKAERDALLDRVRWDAAGELVPPASPLSARAALAYGLRLAIALRRGAISAADGNAAFDRLAAAAKPEL